MKIQTLALVTPPGCDAACPYCVSKMTGLPKNFPKDPLQDARFIHNLEIALALAGQNGVSTIMITGKGEPLLYPKWINSFLLKIGDAQAIAKICFPFVELQTNALKLGQDFEGEEWTYLYNWRKPDLGWGITHVAISVAHYERKMNKRIFTPKDNYIDLPKVIQNLHSLGYTVRLNCIMVKGFIKKKIDAIKELRQATGCGLKEAKDAIERVWDTILHPSELVNNKG
jgi:molybdenum cofactor biosynthesis enzyme MoaA